MTAGLRALLADVIDFAGLFPPAQLPLDQALRLYARYRDSQEAWMLARFICPSAKLQEIPPYRQELFATGAPLLVSALGRGGANRDQFLEGLQTDLASIATFHEQMQGRGVVDAFEVKAAEEPILDALCDLLEHQGPPRLHVFLELSLTGDWLARTDRMIAEVGAFTRGRLSTLQRCAGIGVKLRTGGLEAAAFPTSAQIAHVMYRCRLEGVAMKATAGLHHPLRHRDAGLDVMMHGFLNMFTAGVLAHARGLEEPELKAVLDDQDPASFVFDNNGLRWKDRNASLEEIKAARRLSIVSFGSCSFDEPRDDLRGLGLL